MALRRLPEEELSLRPLGPGAHGEALRSEIVFNGQPTGRLADGVLLEAAIAWNGAYLLFTTDDVPQEDFLSIQLFDKDFTLLDRATLGAMYSTGSFSALQFVEPDSVVFRFIGDTDWKIELLRQPVLGLPLLGHPKGVRRKFGFVRHFRLHGHPHPA
jgi:hypothetical protein